MLKKGVDLSIKKARESMMQHNNICAQHDLVSAGEFVQKTNAFGLYSRVGVYRHTNVAFIDPTNRVESVDKDAVKDHRVARYKLRMFYLPHVLILC
jgi:hypothetical protein